MEILFVRLSSFGDVLFALPAAKALRTSLVGARLTWAIEPPLAPLVEGAAYVDDVLPVDTRGWRRAWRAAETREEIRGFLRRLRGADFDLVVDAQGLFKSAIVTAAASSAARKVGFGGKTATERVNCLVTDERVNVDRAAHPHVLDQMLALAEHVTGRSGFDRTPDVRHLVEKENPEVDAWLDQMGGRRFAVLQPFSSKVNKEWPASEVVAAAEWLSSEGIQPVLRWGPGEEGRAAELIHPSRKSSSLLSPSNSSLPLLLAPPTNPASTARLAARAALFVGADTGPTHLAAAAGTPTLALFGPTPSERFGPVGKRTAVLRESTANYNRSVGRWPVENVREAARLLLA